VTKVEVLPLLTMQDTVAIVLFNVLPQMVDIVMACSYLAARMQPWVAVIVLITVSSYVPLTVGITERRGKVGHGLLQNLSYWPLKSCSNANVSHAYAAELL
jgi:hypothetical protein